MDAATEQRLLDELIELRAARAPFVGDGATSPSSRYTDTDAFDDDLRDVFRRRPTVVAHSSELAEPGSFVTRDRLGTPMLVCRTDDRSVRAFANVCRHRGARVVLDGAGCARRFACPYHAWTYSLDGALVGVPARDVGFADLDRDAHGLVPLACDERHGLVWVVADPATPIDLDDHLGPIGPDLDWAGIDGLVAWAVDEREWRTNWKFLVEGGLEAYHFQVAHRATIAPLFVDNLSTFEVIGRHIRSVLAKRSIDQAAELPAGRRRLRDHSNVLYSVFPSTAILVQPEHVALVEFEPVAVDRSITRVTTLVPACEVDATAKWDLNHRLTVETLVEDFVLAEQIQRGVACGANEHYTFGRFESALGEFHEIWERERRAAAG